MVNHRLIEVRVSENAPIHLDRLFPSGFDANSASLSFGFWASDMQTSIPFNFTPSTIRHSEFIEISI